MTGHRCPLCGAELPRHYPPCLPTKAYQVKAFWYGSRWLPVAQGLSMHEAIELREAKERTGAAPSYGIFTALGSRVLVDERDLLQACQAQRRGRPE